ncbi:MAG: serine/threonine protein kinase [Candidatus Bathyarchaeota archaeon]|nr:serine/threonine protein kinase [Candidatus Bathyarchaeota archaeon]
MPKKPAVIPIDQLGEAPYAAVVCYPRATAAEIKQRIEELGQHSIEALEFNGQAEAFGVPILGKGYVGIVVVGHLKGTRVAVKMRRVDADRVDLKAEAELLQRANVVGAGPKFIGVSGNFMVSELVDGDLLVDWLKKAPAKAEVRRVLGDILEQCWRLDEAGLDHGELSKAPKHLLINNTGKPYIVDFESASPARKVINVTSVCQYLFQGRSDAHQAIAQVLGEKNWDELVAALRKYGKERNRTNFDALMKLCLSDVL